MAKALAILVLLALLALPRGPQERPPAAPVDLPRPVLTPRPAAVAGLGEGDLQRDLGGTWQFHPDPPPGFATDPDPDDAGWTSIQVPGEWAMQGFDLPAERIVGYRRVVEVPAVWAGRRVKLRCDAIYGRAVLWIDGHEAAVSERTFTPFEVDVTDLVTPGRSCTIAIAMTTACLADALTYGSGYARHPLGGILRPMTLFAVPAVHAARFQVVTIFDERYAAATLRVLLTLAGEAPVAAAREVGVEMELAPLRVGPEPAPLAASFRLPAPAPGAAADHVLEMAVAAPAKWHPEHPNLYRLTLRLTADGAPLETLEKRIGFRQVEVCGRELRVNGRRTKLRGINRHESHPRLGRAVGGELSFEDARLFREANVNHVRTSHYPPDESFVDACDELGLYVEVESPITWVGHGAASPWKEWDYRDPRYLPYLARFALETIERDRSHPSVILWSLGNESVWSESWARVAATARLADPTRPLVFHDQAYGGFNNAGSDLPIANFHYPGPDFPAEIATRTDRPLYFGEYCHLNVYNRQELIHDPGLRDVWGEALAPMWEKIFASEVVIGGAIWSGVDDRFLVGEREVGYGSWGPLDGWRRKKPEFWHIQKCYSPLRLLTTEVPVPAPGEEIVLAVENRMEWTDLAELGIEVGRPSRRSDRGLPDHPGEPGGEEPTSSNVVASGAPGTKGTVRILLREPDLSLGPGDSLPVICRERSGRVIDQYLLTIGTPPAPPSPDPAPTPERRSFADRLEVVAGNITWSFDRATGAARCTAAGQELVRGGPYLHIASLEQKYTLFLEVQEPGSLEPVPVHTGWRLEALEVAEGEGTATVTARGAYGETAGWFAMEIDGAGELRLTYEFAHRGEPVEVQEEGVVFLVPARLDELQWERDGQWSAYPEDHLGGNTGRARAFRVPGGAPDRLDTKPDWRWEEDQLPTGTNAFRATKRNVRSVALRDSERRRLEVLSDGSQHTRTWVSGDAIRLLVAETVGPGSETFLAAHWADRRRTLGAGDVLRGTAHLRPAPDRD
ncbi:MAG: glycoside hydrolase family 2 TIM barrel-domain containing protein [Planctomycetota bacterium]